MATDSPFDSRKPGDRIVFVGRAIDETIHVGDTVVLRRAQKDVHIRVTSVENGHLRGRNLADGTNLTFAEQHVFRCT